MEVQLPTLEDDSDAVEASNQCRSAKAAAELRKIPSQASF